MWNTGENTSGRPMTWRPRKKLYTTTNNTYDPSTREAYSYEWCYLRVIGGKNVFNDYYYSAATRCHQRELRELLKKLRIKIHITVNTRESLFSLNNALNGMYTLLYQAHIHNENLHTRNKINTSPILKDIATHRKLGAVCSKKTRASIKATCLRNEAHRIEHAKKMRAMKADVRQKNNEILNNSWRNVA